MPISLEIRTHQNLPQETFMAFTGPNTFFPLNGVSKKQACVSHSTPEAEIVAANAAARLEGVPALQLWDAILERKVIGG